MTDVIYGRFEWNAQKADRNLHEHDVSFKEATTVFDDLFFSVYRSDEHSIDEDRYVIIGTSDQRPLARSGIY